MKSALMNMIAVLGISVLGQQILACGDVPINTPFTSVTSCDGRSTLVMQGDGNLVLYNDGQAAWSTGTSLYSISQANGGYWGNKVRFAVMQSDGNLVIYGDRSLCSFWYGCSSAVEQVALWNSGTGGNGGANLIVQNDGNLVIYNSSWAPVWNTNTSTR